jgi:hypothetical protein
LKNAVTQVTSTSPIFQPEDLAYLSALVRLLPWAQVPTRPAHVFADGTVPQANECYENARRMGQDNPHIGMIYGWLVCTDRFGQAVMVGHFLNRDETGAYIDVTPLAPSYEVLGFLPDGQTARDWNDRKNRLDSTGAIDPRLAALIADVGRG